MVGDGREPGLTPERGEPSGVGEVANGLRGGADDAHSGGFELSDQLGPVQARRVADPGGVSLRPEDLRDDLVGLNVGAEVHLVR